MMTGRLYFEVRIRYFPSYPCPGGASTVVEGVWSCVSTASPEIQPVFVFVGEVLCLVLPIYETHFWQRLLRWFVVAFAQLFICLLQQALPQQTLSGSDVGGARTMVHPVCASRR